MYAYIPRIGGGFSGRCLNKRIRLQIAIKREPTSGLENRLPKVSSYEFACTRSSLSYCVRESRMFKRFWVVRRC
jgi:hypothetical protein